MFRKLLTSVSVLVVFLGAMVGSPVVAQETDQPPAAAVVRMRFAPGATSAQVDANLGRNRVQDYLIRVGGGQTMMLNLTANNDSARVAVYPRFNRRSLRGGSSQTEWSGRVPWTGDYLIRVTGDISTQFSLNVTIPQRITFRRRAISAMVTGKTDAHRTVTYLLRARNGQVMTATLSSTVNVSPTAPVLGLTIYGYSDGIPLVRAEGDATSWSGVLSGTQDYVIEAKPAIDTPITFTLGVTVTGR